MKMTNWTAEKSTNKRLKSRTIRRHLMRARSCCKTKRRAHYKILIYICISDIHIYIYMCICMYEAGELVCLLGMSHMNASDNKEPGPGF